MATLVDRLVTEAVLDPRKFVHGANQVKHASGGLVQTLGKGGGGGGGLGSLFESVGSGMQSVVGAIPGIGLAIGGIAAALGGMAWAASKASREFDLLKRQMSGLLGGMGPANQMMEFIMAYSQPSMFDFEPLANAAKQLLMAGLDVNRFLPLAERLAIGMGGTAEDMMDVAGIFRRAVGGQMTEAMGPEGIGRAGINRRMLQEAGAKFDASGAFVGTLEDFFNAVEKASMKLKGVQDEMGASFEATWANLVTEFKRSLIQAGDAINKNLFPVIGNLTRLIGQLNSSGVFTRIADTLSKFILGENGDSPLIDMIAMLVGVVQSFPQIMRAALGVFRIMMHGIHQFIENLAALPVIGAAFDPLRFKSPYSGIAGAIQATKDAAWIEALPGIISGNMAAAQSTLRGGGANTGTGVLPLAPLPLTSAFAGGGAGSELADIAEYTRQTAENTKPDRLRDLIMGGAAIGGKGIQQREFSRPRAAAMSMDARLLKAIREYVDGATAQRLGLPTPRWAGPEWP